MMTSLLNEYANRQQINKAILRLALPMAITQLITTASSFLCMVMLAKLGHVFLAASALIFSINIAIVVIGMSLLFSLSILIAHAYGAKDLLTAGCLVQQGWLFGILISIPIMLIFWNIYPILIFFGQHAMVSQISQDFFHANIWRVAPALLGVCNQQLCYGIHKQKIDMLANLLSIILLIATTFLFVFGKLGFPPLGVAGFGYALATQAWFYFLFTTLCFYYMEDFKRFHLFRIRIHQNWHTFVHLFKIGWPISLQVSGEMLYFLVCATVIGWLGLHALAAYQVIMQYQFVIVTPILAISQATSILVGQAFGSKQLTPIRKLGQESIGIAAAISTLIGAIFICFPKVLCAPYLDLKDPHITETLQLATLLFAILAFSQLFDAIRNVLTGSLRGLLDTKFPMIIGLCGIWGIGIPLGLLLAFSLHWGAIGIILGSTIGMLLSAIILLYRWHAHTTSQ